MSKKKILSLVVALILSIGVCAPQTALGNRLVYDAASGVNAPSASAVADDDNDADDAAADDATQPKKKGNAFARALSAPFRALARLFGGGRKKSEEAKRREQQQPANAPTVNTTESPAANQTANQTATQTQTLTQAEERKLPASSPSPVSRVVAPSVVAAPSVAVVAPPPSEGARIVRPVEAEAAQIAKPKIWIPVIEGISKDPLTQGRALLEHGYVQEAIAELSVAAARVGPELVEANNLLGIAYDRMGWHIQAAAAYERALAFAPKDAVVIANLGYSLYLANDFRGALKRLKQAARLAPGSPVINNNIAIVHARLQDYGAALKYFTLASNKYDAHLKLAEIFEIEKRDRDAIKHYEAALRLQPGTSALLERLVALYERTGRHDKADTARRALGQPKNPQKTTTGGG